MYCMKSETILKVLRLSPRWTSSARNASSGSPAENPFQTTNLFTKAGPIANIARFLSQHLVFSEDILIIIIVFRSMRMSTVWLRETNFEVIKKGLLIWTQMIRAHNLPVLLCFKIMKVCHTMSLSRELQTHTIVTQTMLQQVCTPRRTSAKSAWSGTPARGPLGNILLPTMARPSVNFVTKYFQQFHAVTSMSKRCTVNSTM